MRKFIYKVTQNAGLLFSGNLSAAAIGAAAIAINARALGPKEFAILALLQTFILVCDRFFSFDTWQPFVASISSDKKQLTVGVFTSAIRSSLKFDLISSIIGGLFGLFVVAYFSELLQLTKELVPFALVYVSTLFLRISGAPIGILRFEGKFKWQALLQVYESLLRLAISIHLSVQQANLSSYLIFFACIAVLRQISQWVIAVTAWRRSEILPCTLNWQDASASVSSEFKKFSISTWVHSSSNVIRQNADIFVLSAFGFGGAVGYYAIAQRASGLLARAADAARYSIFPEITKLSGKYSEEQAKLILIKSIPYISIVLIMPFLVALIFSKQLILLILGAEYLPVREPLLLLVVAQSIYLAGFAIGPLVQTIVSPTAILGMTIPAFSISMIVMLCIIPFFGLNGAGISQIIFNAIWFSIGIVLILRNLKRSAFT